MKDLISVCIPTYNGERFLQEALDSVRAQSYSNIEVIISDDNSHDKTFEICENFKKEVDFPVYIYTHQPSGIGANWNHCIEKANGEYIKFLFQDDILEPDCLTLQHYYVKKYHLLSVFSKRKIIDAKGQIVTQGWWYDLCSDLQELYLNLQFDDFYILDKSDLKRINPPHLTANIFGEPISFLYRKTIFEKVGLFNNRYKQILDVEHSYRILKKYPIGIIAMPLFSFRLHDQQQSVINNSKGVQLPEFKEFEFYLMRNFQFNSKMIQYFLLKYFIIFNVPFRGYLKIRNLFK